MKIAVVGAKGMLGTDLVLALEKTQHKVVAYDFGDIDITKKDSLDKLQLKKPDIVINCAAYTSVDLAESEKEKCFAVNVTGAKNLALVCKEINSVLVHISTDYVFDGKKDSYNETDKKNPINYYGLCKSLGEDEVIKTLKEHYIVRTSWLFGKNGKNFVQTIRKLAAEKSEIKSVTDQTAHPTYTVDLAAQIIYVIENKKPFGVYHCTNSGVCNRFLFAKEIVLLLGFNCEVVPCTSEEFPSVAKRPAFSTLNNNKLPEARSWKKALAEYLGV
jgi:dTDP-4-dehydrorhamnose reductase